MAELQKNAGLGEGCVVFGSFLTRKPWSIERISKGSCANQGGFVQEMTPSITITTRFWRIYTSDFVVFVFRLLKHPQRKKKKKKHSMWAEPRNKPWGGTKPPGKVGADIGTAVKKHLRERFHLKWSGESVLDCFNESAFMIPVQFSHPHKCFTQKLIYRCNEL